MTYLKTRPEVPTFRRIPLFSLPILLIILLKRGFGIPKALITLSVLDCSHKPRALSVEGLVPHLGTVLDADEADDVFVHLKVF